LADSELYDDYNDLLERHKDLKEITTKIKSLEKHRIDPSICSQQEKKIEAITKLVNAYKEIKK
jgi:hypothetical protein